MFILDRNTYHVGFNLLALSRGDDGWRLLGCCVIEILFQSAHRASTTTLVHIPFAYLSVELTRNNYVSLANADACIDLCHRVTRFSVKNEDMPMDSPKSGCTIKNYSHSN